MVVLGEASIALAVMAFIGAVDALAVPGSIFIDGEELGATFSVKGSTFIGAGVLTAPLPGIVAIESGVLAAIGTADSGVAVGRFHCGYARRV